MGHSDSYLPPPSITPPPLRYDNHMLQLFTSSLFLAGALAALIGGWTCNRFGRKSTMVAAGAFFAIGTAIVAGE